ncbi:MAG: DUF4352 domain-containing protein [Lachnospiraceae bacterium]|nr:DUF4352 domain-containing protein [Lachnospiraceae bacterium]
MNLKKEIAVLLLLAVVVFGTGCGDAMYELTEEEQSAIVSYSAHAIAKFNTYQSDGIVYVNPAELIEETETESEIAEAIETEELTETDVESGDENGTESGDDLTEDASQGVEGDSSSDVFGTNQTYNGEGYGSIENLSAALDLGQITAEYMGYEISHDYSEGGLISMTADSGREYFVINIRLNNNSSNAYSIDLLSNKPRFKLLVDGESAGSAITTLLMNDLVTYQGNLSTGESVDTVLLFSVPEGSYESFETLGLSVTMNGNTSNILF